MSPEPPRVRLAYSTLACPAWSVQDMIEGARTGGYGAIELRLLDGEVLHPVHDAAAIRRAVDEIRAAGLEVCAFDTSCRLNVPEGERAAQGEEMREWIALAQELSVPILRVFGGEQAGNEEEQNAQVASLLRELAPEAEEAGVRIALETHDAFSAARRCAAVLAQVPSRAVGLLWDSHHPYEMGESAQEVMDLLGPRIVHVHVKDARRTEDGWQLVLLGEGEVPVAEQLAALEKAGYQGWVSVEWEKKWHPELAEPEVALPQHSRVLAGY